MEYLLRKIKRFIARNGQYLAVSCKPADMLHQLVFPKTKKMYPQRTKCCGGGARRQIGNHLRWLHLVTHIAYGAIVGSRISISLAVFSLIGINDTMSAESPPVQAPGSALLYGCAAFPITKRKFSPWTT
jgi:hypothetical protein